MIAIVNDKKALQIQNPVDQSIGRVRGEPLFHFPSSIQSRYGSLYVQSAVKFGLMQYCYAKPGSAWYFVA